MSQRPMNLIDVPLARLDEAVRVLAAAFQDDPLMRHLYSDAAAPYGDCLTALFRHACRVRFDLGWPLIGVEADGHLAAVLGVSMPGDVTWPDSLREVYEDLRNVTGAEASRRLEAFSELADRGRPAEPHFHVGVLGVEPAHQGKGFGRLLVDAVQDMSEAHGSSVGVALDTENPASRAFYERCGYHVAGEARLDEAVTVSCMFRPNAATKIR